MKKKSIIITKADHAKLMDLLTLSHVFSPRDRDGLHALAEELEKAEIVGSEEVPPDVITMDSRAELLDVETHEEMELTVVYPHDADIDEGRISVLAPVGLGMLGYRVGDVFELPTPTRRRRLKVIGVRYQPEASLAELTGHY